VLQLTKKAKRIALVIIVAIASIVSIGMLQPKERIKVATTTSLSDTGLWEYLEPFFEQRYDVKLDIIPVGTGIAFEYGKRGDVDVLVVHDEARELQFVAEGYAIERIPFVYNYFLIVGPPDDPAHIRGLNSEDAFKKLLEEGIKSPRQVRFVSRGDGSGTHVKEKALWKAAGFDYNTVQKAGKWYIETGLGGMGATLLIASQMGAYTLTDIGTFLVYRKRGLDLVPIIEEETPILLNVYSILVVNPQKHPHVKLEVVNKFVQFLTSIEIQELIEAYGADDYGGRLFIPFVNGSQSAANLERGGENWLK